MTPSLMVDAREVFSILQRHHAAKDGWALFRELRVGAGYTGYLNSDPINRYDQSIDAWAMATWPSQKFRRVAYEIKVSRTDWVREVTHPRKREAAMALSNQFYFICPAGVIHDDEIPEGCGLVVVTAASKTLWFSKQAPFREAAPLPMSFVAMILRRACAAEPREAQPEGPREDFKWVEVPSDGNSCEST